MANPEQLALLYEVVPQRGIEAWNVWRKEHPEEVIDLGGGHFYEAPFEGADLHGARLIGADLYGAFLCGADLTEANLRMANLSTADLRRANLRAADLTWANLRGADLRGADLTGADLTEAVLIGTQLQGAVLAGCRIFGIAAWDLGVDQDTQQSDLIMTRPHQPSITVDSVEVAPFIYLLLNNQRIRDVIDTVTSKVVLILGRFTPQRKAVLDALRERLRAHDYVPVLFDFAGPAERDVTETVTLLARMARFIVADLTEPSSIPKELEAIVPTLAVPVQPLLAGGSPFAMFSDYWKYDWVLPPHRYDSLEGLFASLEDGVIGPAEAKAADLHRRRTAIR